MALSPSGGNVSSSSSSAILLPLNGVVHVNGVPPADVSGSGVAVTLLPIINPPLYFGIVEERVYRSNKFSSQSSCKYIKTLALKTVVYLSPFEENSTLSSFFQHENITVRDLASSRTRPLTEEMVKEAIECILDTRIHPILVMCNTGVHITGAVVGCLRRLQNWSLTSIIDKYRSQAGNIKTRFENEQFIELWDVDTVNLPRQLPSWFEWSVLLTIQEMKDIKRRELMDHPEHPPTYQRYCYDTQGCLTSPNVIFSIKKSIVDDDVD